MKIPKILNTTTWKIANKFGLYSKKQSVEIATNVGKDLIDTAFGGTLVTKEVIQTTLKKYVPSADVKIITDKKEFANVLTTAGEDFEKLDKAIISSSSAIYFNMQGKAKGIYIPYLDYVSDVSNLAHEIEHYMYNEHTPVRKTLVNIVQKFSNLKEKIFRPATQNYEQISKTHSIRQELRRGFGVYHLNMTDGFSGVPDDTNSINKFLAAKNFAGLRDEKRITAYIRAITRHYLHPKNKKTLYQTILAKTTFDDEVRAYTVCKNVQKHVTNSDEIIWEGFVGEIFKKTSKVLKKEILVALNPFNRSSSPIRPGLPKTAYCGKVYSSKSR